MNALELYIGALRFPSKKGINLRTTEELLYTLTALPLTMESSRRTAEIITTLEAHGNPIGVKDSIIAGIALMEYLTLLTRNIKHFSRIVGLSLR